MKLLGFVGLYGTVLAPVGAVIFVDHFLAKRFGIVVDYAEKSRTSFNWSVLIAWLAPVGIALLLLFGHLLVPGRPVDELNNKIPFFPSLQSFYLPLPAWILCGILYLFLAPKRLPTLAGASSEGAAS